MISVKCKITNNPEIADYIRQFNSVVRFAYNRFTEKLSKNDVYRACHELKNIELIDDCFKDFAVMKAQQIFKTGGSKVIFGGRKGFEDKKFKRDTQEAKSFGACRNKWFYTIGAANFKGNRKFNFDLENGRVIFKPRFGIKIPIEFAVTSKNEREMLARAQFLASNKQTPITVSISQEYIVFQIDETIVKKPSRESAIFNRVMAMDSNPNFLGVTVIDFKADASKKNVVYKKVYDLRELNKSSRNKVDFETFQMAQEIARLAKHYRCEIVGYEKLKMCPKNHKKGRDYNRLVNNVWNRRKFFGNLTKWLNIYGVRHQEIAPEYSSFIGQMQNPDEPDMLAAAMEIARRTFIFNRVFIRKDAVLDKNASGANIFSGIVYPNFSVELLPTRWKKMVEDFKSKPTSWKGLYRKFAPKKGKSKPQMSYRFLFKDWSQDQSVISSRLESRKSKILLFSIN